ncbi:hypothetical protein C5167_037762 [Papaver somniferum]|uniref:cellulase n=1 Tax=Papaver somniferum TaxID=3469 RepID=A0A4Y7IAR8_PAPSO|nr:hypothetical protein C5167_037762 [Papaver somniferum]
MYDAGDHMKPGFPMAFTVTVLSWEILEYGDQMDEVSQLEPAQGSLKWITDYLINAHPSPNVLYVQVDDPDVDHKCWQRPEDMTEERPVAKVDEKSPGSDVAGETSAALAAASLRIIQQELPKVQTYYNFTDFGDDLLWAATWLYHATSDKTYLDYVTAENGKSFARWGKPSWFSWDDKHAGTQENCGGCYVWSNT